eukprot:251911-Prorocentrum_minimum.AAC.1
MPLVFVTFSRVLRLAWRLHLTDTYPLSLNPPPTSLNSPPRCFAGLHHLLCYRGPGSGRAHVPVQFAVLCAAVQQLPGDVREERAPAHPPQAAQHLHHGLHVRHGVPRAVRGAQAALLLPALHQLPARRTGDWQRGVELPPAWRLGHHGGGRRKEPLPGPPAGAQVEDGAPPPGLNRPYTD